MNEVKNFYEILPKQFRATKQTYKNYENTRIDIPFRLLIIGASGSGKTNLLLNIISRISAWNKIWLITKNLEEPLYKYLINQIEELEAETRTQILTTGTDIEDIPDVDSFDPKNSNLLILDDIIGEKESKLQNIRHIFIRGRKQNLSVALLSQSFFRLPMLVRQNASHIILKKIASTKDLQRIVAEYSIDKSPEELIRIYKKIIEEDKFKNFMLLDLESNDPRWKIRKNYLPYDESF